MVEFRLNQTPGNFPGENTKNYALKKVEVKSVGRLEIQKRLKIGLWSKYRRGRTDVNFYDLLPKKVIGISEIGYLPHLATPYYFL